MESVFKKLGAPLNNKYFMYHVSNDMEFQTAGSISKLAGNANDDDEYDGKQMLILSGYQKFPETLLQQAAVETFLNQKIKKIAWKQT